MVTRPGVPPEDEIARLTRDLGVAKAALREVGEAQKALTSDAYAGRDVRRWNSALGQAERVVADLDGLIEYRDGPVVYFFCQSPGGHSRDHVIRPHVARFIHGAGEPPK